MRRAFRQILFLLVLSALPVFAAEATSPFAAVVPVSGIAQIGPVPPEAEGAKVLANEPAGAVCALRLEFDLTSVAQTKTPLARLQLGDLEKLKLKRPGQKAQEGRGALHVFVDGKLAGSVCVKPAGISLPYALDVTDAVSAALARAPGQRRLSLEVRLTGPPAFYEAYALRKGPPALEIASDAHWTNDWSQRLQPLGAGPIVYREACLPIATNRHADLPLSLLYPAKKITAVIANATGEQLLEGRDWLLRDGQLVLPAGSKAPIQLAAEFFLAPHKEKNGTTNWLHSEIRLVEGTWYHERQIEVTYEPAAREWQLPKALATLDALPRLKKLLAEKKPVSVLLFGDSISAGGNASKFQGAWPFQPCFGELVAWELERRSGSKITFLNHSRAGAGAAFASTQASSQVAWFKPDLAILGYGMNDRRDERRATFRASMEKMIDLIRADSPDTEFVFLMSMANNPKQPAGVGPIQDLRVEALKISRPGLAFVDMTSTHLELLQHKPYLDTSGNGANHPNDFLHRLYAQRILEVLLPAP